MGGLTVVFAGGRLTGKQTPRPPLPLRVRAGDARSHQEASAHGHMGAGPWAGAALTRHRSCSSSAHHTPGAEKHRRDRKPVGSFMESSLSDPELSTQSDGLSSAVTAEGAGETGARCGSGCVCYDL